MWERLPAAKSFSLCNRNRGWKPLPPFTIIKNWGFDPVETPIINLQLQIGNF